MPELFLSYSHYDREFAQRLAQDLRSKGVKIWLDETEMKPGDSLLTKIGEGIGEVDNLGVVLSPASIASRWVTQELRIALHSEIEDGRPQVVPIYYQQCQLPLILRHRKYIDFTREDRYEAALAELVGAVTPTHQRLTAREAVRLIRRSERVRGELCGLSQQGITQQYTNARIMWERDWVLADAKTGKSAVWVADFYSASEKLISPYGVYDGMVTSFPALNCLGSEPRVVDFNFADSDVAVSAAISRARADGAITASAAYFINTRMRYYTQTGFIWYIFFMDVALGKSFYVVQLSARDGSVISGSRTSDWERQSSRTEANE